MTRTYQVSFDMVVDVALDVKDSAVDLHLMRNLLFERIDEELSASFDDVDRIENLQVVEKIEEK